MTERSTYDRALDLLAFRARSVDELRRRLLQKGADAEEVAAVIERLRDQKLLDDADFARQFARSRIAGSGSSRFRVVQELARKGVSRGVANQAIAELTENEEVDPTAAIHRVAKKKWKTLAALDDATRRRRLYGFLARRGFGPDEIRQVMNSIGEALDT